MKPETKELLVRYKRECYHLLYQHFHGKIKEAQELDKQEAIIDLEMDVIKARLQKKMATDPDQARLEELETKKKQVRKAKGQNRLASKQLAIEYALGIVAPEEQEAY